jgi:hypothetical protein
MAERLNIELAPRPQHSRNGDALLPDSQHSITAFGPKHAGYLGDDPGTATHSPEGSSRRGPKSDGYHAKDTVRYSLVHGTISLSGKEQARYYKARSKVAVIVAREGPARDPLIWKDRPTEVHRCRTGDAFAGEWVSHRKPAGRRLLVIC